MATPIGNVQLAQPAQQFAPRTNTPAPVPARAQPTPTDTVQVSNAARQAVQETIETPAQTSKEAAGGDPQARRLLAREAADKAV